MTAAFSLEGITKRFGEVTALDNVSMSLNEGEVLGLIGQNGSGKSTLMKVMAGLVEPDRGDRVVPAGVSVGYMEQDPDLSGFATLGDYAASALDEGEHYKVEMAAEGLKFRPETPVANASGGEKRRAALAKLMAEAPELMLLDEPTNHLDIEAIEWLEAQLRDTRAAFVLISHDRAFLRALSKATLWIDRGQVRRRDAGFEGFEEWRETVWAEEDDARHKLDRKIKAEAKWAVEGISARRKRNMGRVRALQQLRADRKAQIRRQGTRIRLPQNALHLFHLVVKHRSFTRAAREAGWRERSPAAIVPASRRHARTPPHAGVRSRRVRTHRPCVPCPPLAATATRSSRRTTCTSSWSSRSTATSAGR